MEKIFGRNTSRGKIVIEASFEEGYIGAPEDIFSPLVRKEGNNFQIYYSDKLSCTVCENNSYYNQIKSFFEKPSN